jgi:hypothetical protein
VARPKGRHLSDDVEVNRGVWQAFQAQVRGRRKVDLVVDTEVQSVDSAVSAIASVVSN